MDKESFLRILSGYSKEELNEYIKSNGKKKKPRKMLIYPKTRK